MICGSDDDQEVLLISRAVHDDDMRASSMQNCVERVRLHIKAASRRRPDEGSWSQCATGEALPARVLF